MPATFHDAIATNASQASMGPCQRSPQPHPPAHSALGLPFSTGAFVQLQHAGRLNDDPQQNSNPLSHTCPLKCIRPLNYTSAHSYTNPLSHASPYRGTPSNARALENGPSKPALPAYSKGLSQSG